MTIRNSKIRISFYSNACDGSKTLLINTWYHLIFVYDLFSTTQMIYIDGILDCINRTRAPLQITNLSYIPLTIGYTSPLAPYYFDGLIDQLSLVEWAKNTNFGPNEINKISINTTFENNSLLLNKIKSYFQSSNFVLLGIDNRLYSFSIWINPFQTNGTIILYIFQNSSINTKWCLSFLRFNTQGPYILTYTWTHIVQTYSSINGVSLNINGSLFNTSSPCDYHGGNTPLTITLGSYIYNINETCSNFVFIQEN
ncbi:unnamed protein product [Rotaria sp. Silwood1]|nr:unnamed protein product [Rotaria sp. Silwood1]CAF1488447.1 unnamed protein product [Rotaria sp. Silwood1]CAF4670276.1 unnamed protein product [Rotaria sp. Silwood1]